MQRSEMEEFIKRLIEVIWEKHEHDKLSDFYHFKLEGYYNNEKVNYQQLEKKVLLFKEHMQGIKIEVLDLLIEGNGFALHGYQKLNRDGKVLSIHSILIGYLKDRKIDRYYLKTNMPFEFN